MGSNQVLSGLDTLQRDPSLIAGTGLIGLLYNQASVTGNFVSAPLLIDSLFPGKLKVLFGPQHGAELTEQDNMKETEHGIHPKLGIPLFSLYADNRKPSERMLRDIDTVLVDLQDVGTRVYTYATTIVYLMQECARYGKQVIILDRPNPINGINVEGNVLKEDFSGFVGPFPLPMRHGFTIGELMSFYNSEHGIGCNLDIVKVQGWERSMYFEETGLLWFPPSPNMPLVETAVVYPGMVMLEGTNVSEGRGTTRPFEIFGAPYFDCSRIVSLLRENDALQGIVLREIAFRPTFNKWAGELCKGFQIHILDRSLFKPFTFVLNLFNVLMEIHLNDFAWSDPPYEYEQTKLPIDMILGDDRIRTMLESGSNVDAIESYWRSELVEFDANRSHYFLY